jgi:hypothetical protein
LAEMARREAQEAAAARRAAAPSARSAPAKRRGSSRPRKADTDDPLAGLDSL